MSDSSLKETTVKGLLWGGFSNALIQILNLTFGICLLRRLTPTDYGTIQVLTIFSSVASALQESGFSAALANIKEPTHKDYNAVFWFNILSGAALYLLLFCCAPLIADFYRTPVLVPLSRFAFLSFLFSSWGIAQRAYLFGHLMVKQSSIIFISSLFISGCVAVGMAYSGFAFWGLAAQTVVFTACVTLLNWWYSPWRPSLDWDFSPIRRMFGFSSRLLITTLFLQVNRNVFSVLLGRFYDKAVTGQYGNAAKWNDMGTFTINSMIAGVAQPILTQVKDSPDRYRHVFRKMLRFTSFVSFPCMLGLALVAPEFIRLTAGAKWMPSVPMLQILCLYGAFFPITTLYSNLAISQGRSSINLYNTVATCVVIWIFLIAVYPLGIYAMIISFVSINILWLLVWHGFARRLIGLPLRHALADVLPFCLLAAAAMFATAFITTPVKGEFLRLTAKVTVAALIYIGVLYLSGAAILRESIDYILHKMHRKP
ncbi:MAG: lipopolysaccharide biosynthesis protein [Clostridium sp.]|nr:lipopolysaccharide biosynthesis protein [Clostridium sp.]